MYFVSALFFVVIPSTCMSRDFSLLSILSLFLSLWQMLTIFGRTYSLDFIVFYFQLPFISELQEKRKCSNGCDVDVFGCALVAVAVAAAATFRTTPNNSHAQWCGNSEKSNESDKMTYFTEAWCRCRYSFYEWLSCSAFHYVCMLLLLLLYFSSRRFLSSGFTARTKLKWL